MLKSSSVALQTGRNYMRIIWRGMYSYSPDMIHVEVLMINSSACWLGARIILKQVSPESLAIFDFILELHNSCSGDWQSLVGPDISSNDIHQLLIYAATFCSNLGNYYVCHVITEI